jgi:hypothetical protein
MQQLDSKPVIVSSYTFAPISSAVPVKTKNKKTKEVVHAIFAIYASLCKDQFWVDFFNVMSIGKLPKYFSIADGKFRYIKGKKKIEIPLTPDITGMEDCIRFIRIHSGIYSYKDQENSICIQNKLAQENNKDIKWETCNKKQQEVLIIIYAAAERDRLNLKPCEYAGCINTIRCGINNHTFNKNNIIIEDRCISKIQGLLWNEKERKFYISTECKPLAVRHDRKKEKDVQCKKEINYFNDFIKLIQNVCPKDCCFFEKYVIKTNDKKKGKKKFNDTSTASGDVEKSVDDNDISMSEMSNMNDASETTEATDGNEGTDGTEGTDGNEDVEPDIYDLSEHTRYKKDERGANFKIQYEFN